MWLVGSVNPGTESMRSAVARLLIVLGLLNWIAAGAMAATTSETASHVSVEVRTAYAYDSPAATTTTSATTCSGAFRGYDGPREVSRSRSRTRAELLSLAPKGVNEIPQVGEGIVYRRTSRMGGKPYIGQSKSAARYDARQLEHARENPFNAFDYEILGRSNPGSQLERLEEFFIRQGGGPTTRRNPAGGLANRRHQMREERYQAAGGGF